MSTTKFTGIRSNRNPILRAFRSQTRKTFMERAPLAEYWASRIAGVESDISLSWHLDATVSQQVDAARVLYRYAEVFA